MPPTTQRASISLTLFLLGLSLSLCLALLGQLVFVVPVYEVKFEDARMRVPFITEMTIVAARFAFKYWFLLIPWFLGAFSAVGLLSFLLRHRQGNRWLSATWFALLIGLPLAANGALWLALLLP